jgi:hypothetical protein
MTVRFGPFYRLENAYPSEISNHFPNWKGTTQARPSFKLENDCPQFNNMSMLPPNLESHFFPFNYGSYFHDPQFVSKICKLYSGQRLCQDIYCLLICGDILDLCFSFLDSISNKVVFDLNMFRPFMKHWVF